MEANKKSCIKCDGAKSSGGGLFTCDGCQQMFCRRHVNEHREELNLQLENMMQEHDLMQLQSSQLTPDPSILEQINLWEKETIIKIQKIAETTRANFHQWHQNGSDRIKKECNEFGKNLRSARESEEFSEPDITKWNQILTNLRTQLESMKKIHIIEDQHSYIYPIKIHPDTHSPRNTSVQNDSIPRSTQISNRSTNRVNTNPHEDVHTPSNYSRTRRSGSHHNNNPRNPECKQQ